MKCHLRYSFWANDGALTSVLPDLLERGKERWQHFHGKLEPMADLDV